MVLSRSTWVALGVAAVVMAAAVGITVAHDVPAPRKQYADALVASGPGIAARAAVATAPLQLSEPVTLLSPATKGKKNKDARGDRFVAVSATGSNDVPEAALRAYKNAAASMASRDPGCQIPWTLLAAIGRVESDHGRYGDSVLGSDGVSRPAILGLQLNGAGPVAAIHDTDHGKLDGDKVWDRAVGQMQFIPGTWRMVAADGDGDGVESPNDIDDAALGAANYLCHGGSSVADPSGMARAIYRYNQSDYYVALVMAFQKGYETGVFVIPSPPPPPGAGDGMPKAVKAKQAMNKKHHKSTKHHHHSSLHSTGGSGSGAKPPVKPTPPPPEPTPTAPPSPTPTPTQPPPVVLTFDTRPFDHCGDAYCFGADKLDLGPGSQLGRQAAHDYDGDGTTESNAEEFNGLATAGQPVRLGFEMSNGVAVVYVVGDKDYRGSDGSFL
jgi:membrane-bound lytic murein transglycosylase B